MFSLPNLTPHRRGPRRRPPLRPRTLLILLVLTILAIPLFIYTLRSLIRAIQNRASANDATTPFSRRQKALVVAAVRGDDLNWLKKELPEWDRRVLWADDENRPGIWMESGESAVDLAWLTYIINNYESLSNIMVFIRMKRWQVVNEDPMYDLVPVIRNLRVPHVASVGYANLRCTWSPGCPTGFRDPQLASLSDHPLSSTATNPGEIKTKLEEAYAQFIAEAFTGRRVPERVGIPFGSQFAVTRDKVLERPKSDYDALKEWLKGMQTGNVTAGLVWEFGWHMLFGKPAVQCPDTADCFCNQYGLCDLKCQEGSCENRWQMPPSMTLPKGWPKRGAGKNGWPAKNWWLPKG